MLNVAFTSRSGSTSFLHTLNPYLYRTTVRPTCNLLATLEVTSNASSPPRFLPSHLLSRQHPLSMMF